jgi:succinate semialdehyde reductase
MAWKVMMPKKIMFGENAAKEFPYPKNALVITTTTPDIYNKWLDYIGIKNYELYDKVTPDPAIETVEAIKKQYEGENISCYIGLGGGSSMDVCKYLGKMTGIPKILIPTTFGTGAEMTTYAGRGFPGRRRHSRPVLFARHSIQHPKELGMRRGCSGIGGL